MSIPIEVSDDGKLPTEKRILSFGVNHSEKGDFVLDKEGASELIANFRARAGTEPRFGMMDLEHLSIDQSNPNYDPDARAWWDLQVRDDGVYLVDMSFTEDGAARVKSKKQRFLSPTFLYDKDRRVRRLHNVALTAQPALHGMPALVAASAASAAGDTPMAEDNSQDLAATIAGALKSLGIDPKVQQALAKSLGIELTGDTEKDIAAIKTAMDEYSGKVGKVLQLVKEIKGGAEPPSDAPSDSPPSDSPPADAQMASVAASLVASTGVAAGDLAGQVEIWRKAFLSMQAKEADIAKQKAEIEHKERCSLVATLVAKGFEIPATAWEKGKEGKLPVARLNNEPIEDLRARVAVMSNAAGGTTPKPPADTGNPHGLTEQQMNICKEVGCEPATFARLSKRS